MEKLNRELVEKREASHSRVRDLMELPEKVLQFGEGNFLRGFVDWMIHQMNKQNLFNGRVVAIQPTPRGKVVPKLNRQNGLYTLILRGMENGETVDRREVISSISRGINPYTDWPEVLQVAANPEIQIVFSNTTEAGLDYMQEKYDPHQSPLSFPGKLTACLYHRYQVFQGAPDKGWIIIPCELIEDNGTVLRQRVLQIADDWHLPREFSEWVIRHNRFCTTLVDRIVTGYPKEHIDQLQQELGYEDELLTVGEPYHLFAIDGDRQVQEVIPFHQAGLNVYWADVKPFRELKVKILNGAHTMMYAVGTLAGMKTVLEVMEDTDLNRFVTEGIYEEILPVLDIGEAEKQRFAQSVLERFRNPFNKHYLLDISLNAIPKFRARLLPTLKTYAEQKGKLPDRIVYSLAAIIAFYKGDEMREGQLIGKVGGEEYVIRDSEETLRFFQNVWNHEQEPEKVAEAVLGNVSLWGEDLNPIPGLTRRVSGYLADLLKKGVDLQSV